MVKVLGQETVHSFTANRAITRATVSAVKPAALGRKFYKNETPLTVGIGPSTHSTTGSNCKKILEIEESMLHSVLSSCFKDGVYIPPTIQPKHRMFFAIDNFYLARDTKDEKDQWHFTIITLFQNTTAALKPYLQANEFTL